MITCSTFYRPAGPAVTLSLLSVLFAVPISAAEPRSETPSSITVKGQVSAVEGEYHMAKDARGEDILTLVDRSYIVTTLTGQQIELKLTLQTKVPTRANPGDEIEAKVSEEGQTLSVMLVE